MEENARRPLEAAGIDVDEALARFMGNEALLTAINTALNELIDDGTVQSIIDTYITAE